MCIRDRVGTTGGEGHDKERDDADDEEQDKTQTKPAYDKGSHGVDCYGVTDLESVEAVDGVEDFTDFPFGGYSGR